MILIPVPCINSVLILFGKLLILKCQFHPFRPFSPRKGVFRVLDSSSYIDLLYMPCA